MFPVPRSHARFRPNLVLSEMPILPYEPDIYPEDLLDESSEDRTGRVWWVLYTLPRREKDLLRRLRQMEIAHYGPLVRRRTRSPSGRTRQSFVPLFPSYVFMKASEEERYQAMKTNCISRYLEVADADHLVTDLRQIQQLIASDAPLTPEARLESGTLVRVRSGPMMGLEGVVIRRRGEERLLVAVEFLQQGASVLIEDFQVEAI